MCQPKLLIIYYGFGTKTIKNIATFPFLEFYSRPALLFHLFPLISLDCAQVKDLQGNLSAMQLMGLHEKEVGPSSLLLTL